jgi:hypothetical protein
VRRYAILLVAASLTAVLIASCRENAVAPRATDVSEPRLAQGAIGKIAICHSSGGKKFNEVAVSDNAAGGHLDANGNPRAGHDQDYLVTDRTPCPPPATDGSLQLCKVGAIGIPAGTSFMFVVNGENIVVAAGACVTRSYRVGTHVQVQEASSPNSAVESITLSPVDAGTTNVPNRSANVTIGTDIAVLTVTNHSTTVGEFVVCKIAGMGVTVGSFTTFVVSGVGLVNVTAGAKPDGNCSAPMLLSSGPRSVLEISTGEFVTSMEVAGQTPTVDLANNTVVFDVIAGARTTLRVTNATMGELVLCKVAGADVTPGVSFLFLTLQAALPGGTTPILRQFTVQSGAGPTGNCNDPVPFVPGQFTITELGSPDVLISAITASPASRLVSTDLPNRSAVATVLPDARTTLTITNVAAQGTLVVCAAAGPGIVAGTNYTFQLAGVSAPIIVTAGQCSAPIALAATLHSITQNVTPPTMITDIAVNPAANLFVIPPGTNVLLFNIHKNETTTVTFTNVLPP